MFRENSDSLVFLLIHLLSTKKRVTDPRNPPEQVRGDPGGSSGGPNKWHTLFGGSHLNPPEQVEAVRGVI